jgi:hypothetical protein
MGTYLGFGIVALIFRNWGNLSKKIGIVGLIKKSKKNRNYGNISILKIRNCGNLFLKSELWEHNSIFRQFGIVGTYTIGIVKQNKTNNFKTKFGTNLGHNSWTCRTYPPTHPHPPTLKSDQWPCMLLGFLGFLNGQSSEKWHTVWGSVCPFLFLMCKGHFTWLLVL